MPDDAAVAHYDAEALLDYFEMRLPEDEQLVLEEHLDACAHCVAVAAQTQRAAALLDSWTAQAHSEAYLTVQMQRALVAAQARRS